MKHLSRIALWVFLATPALANDGKQAGGSDLPGVGPKTAQPLPAPEPLDAAPDAEGFVRHGDWDVKVSGSITIDVGTFLPPNR